VVTRRLLPREAAQAVLGRLLRRNDATWRDRGNRQPQFPPSDGLPTALPQHFEDWRDGDVGAILTQDFSNMSEVTIGLHSRHYDGHRLNTEQEMTIWNYHRAMDEFLFD
jgi:hypothetical protein